MEQLPHVCCIAADVAEAGKKRYLITTIALFVLIILLVPCILCLGGGLIYTTFIAVAENFIGSKKKDNADNFVNVKKL